MIRKCAIGLVLLGGAVVANPFNHADAAQGNNGNPSPRAALRQCAHANVHARNQAVNQLRSAARNATDQAALDAAKSAFINKAIAARDTFNSCAQDAAG
jgi:hypothetical protein